jgi:AbrB family looped-hinge helix DNA binding protein
MLITTAKINSKNQITLPREVRDATGIKHGDELLFIIHDGGISLRLRPVSFAQALRGLHKNVWANMDVEHWLTKERRSWEERRSADPLPPHVP